MITDRTELALIMRLVLFHLSVTIFDENKSHLEKNKQQEINPTAQKTRHSVSLAAIVIKP